MTHRGSPLIFSVDKGEYKEVVFMANGKRVATVKISRGRAQHMEAEVSGPGSSLESEVSRMKTKETNSGIQEKYS